MVSSVSEWLPGGSARRLRRAVARLAAASGPAASGPAASGPAASGPAASGQPDPATYREALLLALRHDPATAIDLWRTYDARIAADRYRLAFRPDDEPRLTALAARPDRQVLTVVFEVADRLGLSRPRRAARDHLLALLGGAGDADALVFHLQRWHRAGVLDPGVLAGAVRAHLARVPLRRDAPQWTAFLDRLPAPLVPDLFEVRVLLGQGADAVRLADGPAREQEALDCCAGSPRLVDVEAGLGLARRRGDQDAARRLQERAGDLLVTAGRFGEALLRYHRAGRTDRVSECHEQLGQFAEALATCPDGQPHRLAALAGRCRAELDLLVERHAFEEAARAAGQLAAELDRATPVTDAVRARAAEVADLRAAVLAAGRDHFADLVRQSAAGHRRAAHREWSRFEEAAGEPAEAARHAEAGGDRYRAHRLFRDAGRHGDAVRVLRHDSTAAGLTARAEAAAAGGDLVGAARLRMAAGQPDEAVDLYQRAGEHAAAAETLRTWLGDDAIEDPRLADALCRAGDVDGLVRWCLAAIDRRGTGTRAVAELRRLSGQALIPAQRSGEVLAALDRIGAHPRRPFERRAQVWVAQARDEVDTRFAGIWGLDLGTTTSTAAIFDSRAGKPVLCQWKGHDQFASTLSVDGEGTELVGLAGEELLAASLLGSVEAAKRAMGTGREYRIGHRGYRPEEVAARLIQHARGLVENFLAARVRDRVAELARAELGEVPDDWLRWAEAQHDLRLSRPRAILTIPANFWNNQKQATRDACAIAGMEPVRLIHEPTAACISAARERRLDGRVVVVDLGAGTLDVSYLEIDGNVYDVQQVLGNNEYGGKDFDAAIGQALARRLAADGVAAPDTVVGRRRLEAAAEYLKIALSAREHADYTLRGFGGSTGDRDVRLELTRAQLADILADQLRTLRRTCEQLRDSLKQKPEHLVLVGGPMLAPLIRNLVEEAFDTRAVPVSDPRTAVAYGAALQAAVLDGKLSELLLLDVTPLALGIRAANDDEPDKDRFSVVIEPNTTIPIERRQEYSTVRDNQTAVDIEIFNGQLDPAARIGHFRLEGIPPAPRGVPEIEVTFTIDASCVLEVTAKDRGTGRSKSIRVTDTTLLSPGEVDELARRHRRHLQWVAARDRLRLLVTEARALDSEPIRREFRSRLSGYRPGAGPVDPGTEATLAEMFARAAEIELELLVVHGPMRDLATKAGESLAQDRPPGSDADVAEVRHLADALSRHVDQFRALAEQVGAWTDLLVRLAVAEPDPLRRFRALYRSGRYAEALATLPVPPADGTDLHRYLRCLAETGDVARYRRLLFARADVLCAPDLARLDAPDAGAVVPVLVDRSDGPTTGTGFLVTDRLAVTNRHWLVAGGVTVDAAQVTVAGAAVEAILLPPGSHADVAVLRLAGPVPATPLRLGHPKLARVGDQVWTPGVDGGAPVQGVIDRFETFPAEGLRVFRTGLRLPPRASGGPLLNDLGEVLGVLSIPERLAGEGAFAVTVDALDPVLSAAGYADHRY